MRKVPFSRTQGTVPEIEWKQWLAYTTQSSHHPSSEHVRVYFRKGSGEHGEGLYPIFENLNFNHKSANPWSCLCRRGVLGQQQTAIAQSCRQLQEPAPSVPQQAQRVERAAHHYYSSRYCLCLYLTLNDRRWSASRSVISSLAIYPFDAWWKQHRPILEP